MPLDPLSPSSLLGAPPGSLTSFFTRTRIDAVLFQAALSGAINWFADSVRPVFEFNVVFFQAASFPGAIFLRSFHSDRLSCLSVSPRRYLQLPFCFSWALFLVSDNFVITNVWFFFLSRHSNSFVFLHRFVSFISFLLFNYISCHPSKSGLSPCQRWTIS